MRSPYIRLSFSPTEAKFLRQAAWNAYRDAAIAHQKEEQKNGNWEDYVEASHRMDIYLNIYNKISDTCLKRGA